MTSGNRIKRPFFAVESRQRAMRRRTFMKGAAAATVPLFLGGLTRPAYAASPKRVLFVFVPDGVTPNLWHPTGSETGFTLPEMSQPLEAIRNDCVFLSGLDMYAGGATHEGGVRKVLTGNAEQSLDIFLGEQIGSQSLHKSVQLGVASQFENGSGYVSLIGPEQFVEPDDNPLNAFDNLFGGITGEPDPERELRKLRDKSVLDTALADVNSLRDKLGTTERAKLDIHLESLREVERRVSGDGVTACGPELLGGFNPDGYEHTVPPYYPLTYHEEAKFEMIGGLQMDVARLALTCDVTRVVSLQWSHPVSPTRVDGLTAGNHDLSHMGGPDFVKARQWFMTQFVKLIEQLRGITEEDGTLLDNTLVVLTTELGDSNLHDHRSVPFVLAGGKNLGLVGGRFLDYTGSNNGENEPHTKMLVSIANAMGADIDSYGYTGHGTGPLPGLFG